MSSSAHRKIALHREGILAANLWVQRRKTLSCYHQRGSRKTNSSLRSNEGAPLNCWRRGECRSSWGRCRVGCPPPVAGNEAHSFRHARPFQISPRQLPRTLRRPRRRLPWLNHGGAVDTGNRENSTPRKGGQGGAENGGRSSMEILSPVPILGLGTLPPSHHHRRGKGKLRMYRSGWGVSQFLAR